MIHAILIYWQWSNNQKINDTVVEILMMYACMVPYSGKLSREKTFTNFAIFLPSAKVFSIRHATPIM